MQVLAPVNQIPNQTGTHDTGHQNLTETRPDQDTYSLFGRFHFAMK